MGVFMLEDQLGTVEVVVSCETDFGGLAYVTPGNHRVTRAWTETVDAARTLIAQGATVAATARALSISRSTLHRHLA